MGFLRNTGSGRQSLGDRPLFKFMIAGLIPLVILVLLAIFVPSLTQGIILAPVSMILILLTIGLLANATRTPDATEKRKRELENVDMYSMIDRLVGDLDDDELAHLRRRLEEREQGRDPKLSQSLEALLDKRSETRQNQSQQ